MDLDAIANSLLPCLTRIQSGGWKIAPSPFDNCQPLMVGLMPKLLTILNHFERNTMQFYINMTKAKSVINSAPAINSTVVTFKQDEARVELFDYGTPMGWGRDFRVRVFLNGLALPLSAIAIYERKRPAWLPDGVTINDWNAAVQAAVQTIKP
jgi:hypothetical protein